MKLLSTPDGRLGIVCILLALFALVVWVPLDIDTGLVEKVRRRVSIGDSLLPVVALGFVILGGLMTIARSAHADTPTVTLSNAFFLLKIFGVLAGSLAAMRWLGPLVAAVAGEDATYRALRDTPPWKYMGFIAGGSLMVMGLIALVERRLTLRGLLIGILTAIALVLIYDLPFEDLLLPPNGDV